MVELFAIKFVSPIQTICQYLFRGCCPPELARWIFWQRISCVSLVFAYEFIHFASSSHSHFFLRLPLIFVLMVTAVKDFFEDRRRYLSDRRVNNSTCRVYKRYEYVLFMVVRKCSYMDVFPSFFKKAHDYVNWVQYLKFLEKNNFEFKDCWQHWW